MRGGELRVRLLHHLDLAPLPHTNIAFYLPAWFPGWKLHNQIPSIYNENRFPDRNVGCKHVCTLLSQLRLSSSVVSQRKVNLGLPQLIFTKPLLVNRGFSRVVFFFLDQKPQYVCSIRNKSVFGEPPGNEWLISRGRWTWGYSITLHWLQTSTAASR